MAKMNWDRARYGGIGISKQMVWEDSIYDSREHLCDADRLADNKEYL
ncbi:MAG: hypothetical protein HOC09_11210 [Deltaproteobacteria bacterium]|jgi:hypothetical protein|nr:hypothetical protein [Deltaproteobacteria bacterium]